MVRGYTVSGAYAIQPNASKPPVVACCDMDTDGGGWTVIQRRVDNFNFRRNWEYFATGFGTPCESAWLGLENIHQLTETEDTPPQLRVDLEDSENNTAFAKYNNFYVAGSMSTYTLFLNGYNNDSTAGNALINSNGKGIVCLCI